MSVSADYQKVLDEVGYVLLPDFFSGPFLDDLRSAVNSQFEREGAEAGHEFKQEPGCRRLANLVNKGPIFRDLIVFEPLRPYLEAVLGKRFKLSSLNARCVLANCSEAQPLHADMAAIPDERGYWVCNTIWMLDDFTADNGAPRAVPGSHRFGKLPTSALTDLKAPHPDEEIITGTAGSVIVMNAHVWHGGMPNHTAQTRTAVHGFYTRWDRPQQQYQKAMLDEPLQSTLSPRLRQVLALDDPLNDELSSGDVVRSGFMK